jgi:hypothetical protein
MVDVDTSRGFWMFQADGFSVGTGAVTAAPFKAIADTGTTLMLLNDTIVSAYYAAFTGAQHSSAAGGFVFPCSSVPPDFKLAIGNYTAVVPGDLIKFAPVDTQSLATAKTCFGGLQSAKGLGFGILGDIFLKAQFSAFFGGATPRLGFAPKPI